jgi:RNA polymerase-binding transcription factor DksA
VTILTKAHIAELERRLEERAVQLRQEVEDYRDAASGKQEAAAVATERDQSDGAFATAAATVDRLQLQRDLDELSDIAGAQARMRSGGYGICIDCGGDIGYERLQAWPTAKRCRDCQNAHERRRSA